MRAERSLNMDWTKETDPKRRCQHGIQLGDTRYGCQRSRLHAGTHDAFQRHTDGYLVTW